MVSDPLPEARLAPGGETAKCEGRQEFLRVSAVMAA